MVLYSEKMKKSRSRTRKNSETETQPPKVPTVNDNKQTMLCLE